MDEPGSPANPGDVYHFSAETLWQGLPDKDRLRSEGLLRDWVRWQYRHLAREPSPFPVCRPE